jgi:hypothetical protein
MAEPIDTIDAVIERLVREARIPDRAAREELRRELIAHFEDAAAHDRQQAVARFGDDAIVAAQFQRVYRWDYARLYAIKIAAAVFLSAAVALFFQVLVNLRVAFGAEALRLAPGFAKAALVSVAVVLALAALWEISRPPFDRRRLALAIGLYIAVAALGQLLLATAWQAFLPATMLVGVGYVCARLERAPARLLRLFCAFAALMYAAHLSVRVDFTALQAVLASAALLAVWISTVTILSRCDEAFLSVFHTS